MPLSEMLQEARRTSAFLNIYQVVAPASFLLIQHRQAPPLKRDSLRYDRESHF